MDGLFDGLDPEPEPRQPEPSRRERKAQRWEDASRPFREAAADRRAELRRLAAVAFELFRRMAPDTYDRRQPIALRIPVRAGLSAVVRPSWSHVRGAGDKLARKIDPENRRIILEPTAAEVRSDGKPRSVILATLVVPLDGPDGEPPAPFPTMVASDRFAEYVEVLAAVAPFLDDPLGAFSRSDAPNCGICGRTLTDPSSRAQGIGPECIERVDMLNAIAAAQLAAAD